MEFDVRMMLLMAMLLSIAAVISLIVRRLGEKYEVFSFYADMVSFILFILVFITMIIIKSNL